MTIVETSTLLIVLLALCVSIHEGMLQRKHNQLSVAPQLTCTHARDGITLVNRGLGPALVTRIQVFVDGQLFSKDTRISDWIGILTKLGLAPDWVIGEVMHAPASVSVGQTVRPLFIPPDKLTPEGVQLFSAAMNRLKIVIEYKSLYEKTYTSNIDIKSRTT